MQHSGPTLFVQACLTQSQYFGLLQCFGNVWKIDERKTHRRNSSKNSNEKATKENTNITNQCYLNCVKKKGTILLMQTVCIKITAWDKVVTVQLGWCLTLVLLNQDVSCFANSVDPDQLVSRSQLIWIFTVIKYANLYQQNVSSNLIGWKLEVGVAS